MARTIYGWKRQPTKGNITDAGLAASQMFPVNPRKLSSTKTTNGVSIGQISEAEPPTCSLAMTTRRPSTSGRNSGFAFKAAHRSRPDPENCDHPHVAFHGISESTASRSDDRNIGKGRIRNAAGWRPLKLGLLTTQSRQGTVQRPHWAKTSRCRPPRMRGRLRLAAYVWCWSRTRRASGRCSRRSRAKGASNSRRPLSMALRAARCRALRVRAAHH